MGSVLGSNRGQTGVKIVRGRVKGQALYIFIYIKGRIDPYRGLDLYISPRGDKQKQKNIIKKSKMKQYLKFRSVYGESFSEIERITHTLENGSRALHSIRRYTEMCDGRDRKRSDRGIIHVQVCGCGNIGKPV